MAFLIRECSGIVCLCLTDEKADALNLPPMVAHNESRQRTAFTVSIEARDGVSTGVCAADRVTTIRAAIAPHAAPAGVLCELMNADGTMMRGAQVNQFAAQHRLPVLTIAELVALRESANPRA